MAKFHASFTSTIAMDTDLTGDRENLLKKKKVVHKILYKYITQMTVEPVPSERKYVRHLVRGDRKNLVHEEILRILLAAIKASEMKNGGFYLFYTLALLIVPPGPT